jgi:hypothetical protein
MGEKQMPSAVAPECFEGEQRFISRRAPEQTGIVSSLFQRDGRRNFSHKEEL